MNNDPLIERLRLEAQSQRDEADVWSGRSKLIYLRLADLINEAADALASRQQGTQPE